MLISIILDNYNYARFLPQAIDSVLAQSYEEWELIIVDDGSTDESQNIIQAYADKEPRIKPIFKQNGGQASAFNAGFAASCGDVLCFLDSDDYFAPAKLERIAAMMANGYDYVYNDNFSVDTDGVLCDDDFKRYRYDGNNLFLVYYLSKYPGCVTSTLSIRRSLALCIFPIEDEEGWRIQADDPIVFQAAMMGRAKYFDEKLTYYRIHNSNGHYGKKRSSDYLYDLLKKRNRLKDIALKKTGVSRTFLNNSYNLLAEFDTHKVIDKNLLNLYLNLLWFQMDLPILNRIKSSIELYKRYKKRLNE